MSPIKCFLITPTDRAKRYLRRYNGNSHGECPVHGYHNGKIPIEDGPDGEANGDTWDHSDPRWPYQCACGYVFAEADTRQLFTETIWVDENGEEYTLESSGPYAAPAGAMWDCTWMHHIADWCGPDGRCIAVRLPDGSDWQIDSKANNCTRRDDTEHRCWIRHGEPPNLHVDKDGNTCQAGAGSILTSKWHGFLHNGYLVEC